MQGLRATSVGEIKALGYFEDVSNRLMNLASTLREEAGIHDGINSLLHGTSSATEKSAPMPEPAGYAGKILESISVLQGIADRNLADTRRHANFAGV